MILCLQNSNEERHARELYWALQDLPEELDVEYK